MTKPNERQTVIEEILAREKQLGIKFVVTDEQHRKTLEGLSDYFLRNKLNDLRKGIK